MQNAKDSFYVAVRNRLAELNPARTCTLRAVQRPGIFVEEAEAPMVEPPNDVFVLRWTKAVVQQDLPLPLFLMECEVHYATSGSQTAAGLDRGRALAEMDGELVKILTPMCTRKLSYTSTPALPMETLVFWTEPLFGALQTVLNQLQRVVTVSVFAFEEPGER